jgi:hypothetical protein
MRPPRLVVYAKRYAYIVPAEEKTTAYNAQSPTVQGKGYSSLCGFSPIGINEKKGQTCKFGQKFRLILPIICSNPPQNMGTPGAIIQHWEFLCPLSH